MEHESPSTWLDAHLDGDARWADADTAVLVDETSIDGAAGPVEVIDAGGAGGPTWLDGATTPDSWTDEHLDTIVVTDADVAATVEVDADVVVPEPAGAAGATIVDPFDDFIARTAEADEPTESSAGADAASIDDVAPAPPTAELAPDPGVEPEPAAELAPEVAATEPAVPSPAGGYDAFDSFADPADDWSVDLTPDAAADLDDEPGVADDDHLDDGDLA